MDIEIIRANPPEHAVLTQIAQDSKGYWGYPEAWLTAWSEQLCITPEMIDKHQIYKAVDQGMIAAFYVLAGHGEKMVLDHLWVKPEYIGMGIGQALFKHAMLQAAALGAHQVEIEADPHALGFYLKMGARQVSLRSSSLERELPILVMEVRNASL